jgi:hypothetical protein
MNALFAENNTLKIFLFQDKFTMINIKLPKTKAAKAKERASNSFRPDLITKKYKTKVAINILKPWIKLIDIILKLNIG